VSASICQHHGGHAAPAGSLGVAAQPAGVAAVAQGRGAYACQLGPIQGPIHSTCGHDRAEAVLAVENGRRRRLGENAKLCVRHDLTVCKGLCHLIYKGKMYNGFSQDELTEKGARKLGIENIKSGIFTRCVLMDMARHFGVRYLGADKAIYPEDLDPRSGVWHSSSKKDPRWNRRACEDGADPRAMDRLVGVPKGAKRPGDRHAPSKNP